MPCYAYAVGVGKTSLASYIFDMLSPAFEGRAAKQSDGMSEISILDALFSNLKAKVALQHSDEGFKKIWLRENSVILMIDNLHQQSVELPKLKTGSCVIMTATEADIFQCADTQLDRYYNGLRLHHAVLIHVMSSSQAIVKGLQHALQYCVRHSGDIQCDLVDCRSQEFIFELKPLSDEAACQVLKRSLTASLPGLQYRDCMNAVVMQIAQSCRGLPSSIYKTSKCICGLMQQQQGLERPNVDLMPILEMVNHLQLQNVSPQAESSAALTHNTRVPVAGIKQYFAVLSLAEVAEILNAYCSKHPAAAEQLAAAADKFLANFKADQSVTSATVKFKDGAQLLGSAELDQFWQTVKAEIQHGNEIGLLHIVQSSIDGLDDDGSETVKQLHQGLLQEPDVADSMMFDAVSTIQGTAVGPVCFLAVMSLADESSLLMQYCRLHSDRAEDIVAASRKFSRSVSGHQECEPMASYLSELQQYWCTVRSAITHPQHSGLKNAIEFSLAGELSADMRQKLLSSPIYVIQSAVDAVCEAAGGADGETGTGAQSSVGGGLMDMTGPQSSAAAGAMGYALPPQQHSQMLDPQVMAADDAGGHTYPGNVIWFITDRQVVGNQIHPQNRSDIPFYGKVEVQEAAMWPEARLYCPPQWSVDFVTADAFYEEQRQQSQLVPSVLFIHGYKTSFDSAIYAAAQLAQSLHKPVVAYCWASYGGLGDYYADKVRAEATVQILTEALQHSVSVHPLLTISRFSL